MLLGFLIRPGSLVQQAVQLLEGTLLCAILLIPPPLSYLHSSITLPFRLQLTCTDLLQFMFAHGFTVVFGFLGGPALGHR